jgi:hypothetical protein
MLGFVIKLSRRSTTPPAPTVLAAHLERDTR